MTNENDSKIDGQAVTFGIRTEMFEVGLTEDGEMYIGEQYVLTAEAANGRRWVHGRAFPGAQRGEYSSDDGDFNGFYFEDTREEAEAAVNAFLLTASEIPPADWFETDPVYGSSSHREPYDGDELARI